MALFFSSKVIIFREGERTNWTCVKVVGWLVHPCNVCLSTSMTDSDSYNRVNWRTNTQADRRTLNGDNNKAGRYILLEMWAAMPFQLMRCWKWGWLINSSGRWKVAVSSNWFMRWNATQPALTSNAFYK